MKNKETQNNVSHYRLLLFYIVLAMCFLPTIFNLIGIDFSLKKHLEINNNAFLDDPFNLVLEWATLLIILSSTLVTFLYYRKKQDETFLVIALSLLSISVIEIFHSLVSLRFLTFSTTLLEHSDFTWVLTRTLSAIYLFISILICLWLTHNKLAKITRSNRKIIIIITAILSMSLSVFVLVYSLNTDALPQVNFPRAFVSRPFDVLSVALLLIGSYLCWIWFRGNKLHFRYIILLSFLPAIVLQMHTIFGPAELFDSHSKIAHFLKFLSYFIIFVGCLIGLRTPRNKISGDYHYNDNSNHSYESIPTESKSLHGHKVIIGKVQSPLAIKIPIAGFILSLIISISIGIVFYIESQQLVIDKEIERVSMESEVIKPLLTNFYRRGALDVSFFRGTPAIDAIVNVIASQKNEELGTWHSRLSAIIIELLKTKPHYKRISYIKVGDSNDVLVSAIRSNSKVIELKGDSLGKNIEIVSLAPQLKSKEHKVYFSRFETAVFSQNNSIEVQSSIFVSHPVINIETGELFGLIAIELDLTSYLSALKTSVLKGIKFYVADNNGHLISTPENDPIELSQLTLQAKFPKLQDKFKQYIQPIRIYDHNNKVTLASLANYSKIKYIESYQIEPLHLLVENHNEEFRIAVDSMRFRAILIGLSLAILSLLISIIAARRLIKPLADMSESIMQYETLGRIEQLPITEKDEIGMLARSFHNLLITIDQKSEQQQKAATEAFSASIKLQAILNSIVDAVITIDDKGNIIAFNKSARKMFGYEDEEVFGQNIKILMPYEHGAQNDDHLHNYLNTDNSTFGTCRELPAVRKDGETFPMQLSVSKVEVNGNIIYTGLIRDITNIKLQDAERKRILQETKYVAWRLDFALSGPHIGVWEIDLPSGRLYWDDRTYQLFGYENDDQYSPKEIWKMGVHPEDLEVTNKIILKAIKTGERVQYQHRIILPNKDVKHIEGHAQPMLNEHGQKVKIVGTSRDNTEQYHMQELKQHALDMAEESLRLKSEFLASMSHEIRTPMNGVLGMLGLINQSELTEQQKHYVQLANSSAQSLLTIINDILDFSKIEAGKLDLEIIEFDLIKQFSEFTESMAVRAHEKNLELILDLTEINQSRVMGDPSRLRQILSNLVGNSIKFTNEGEIIIKASICDAEDKLTLLCTITDTGIGIPSNKMSSLFESFTQVDSTTTRRFGGTGLGLAIVRQLCELMGGSVCVTSKINEGSCFEFTIQLQKSTQSKIEMPNVDIKGTKILIVDDNSTNLTVLKVQLEIWGAIVTQAQNGHHALDIIENNDIQFSVAILDMQMPVMDGATLGKLLKEHPKTTKTKLIMMTSMSERGDAAYFANLGFSAYFPKPATTSDLFNALSIVLDDGETLKLAKPLVTHDFLSNIPDRSTVEISHLPRLARVLLVEDNRINQMVLAGVLSNLNLHADIANNGVEALAQLKNSSADNPFEIIIMDCQMPELDGYEATAAIRKGQAGERYINIPIIAMTANAMKGDREKCLDFGMDDYVAKPIDRVVFKGKLCTWLGERKPLYLEKEFNKLLVNSIPTGLDKALVVWTKESFLRRIRNNMILAKKLIEVFLEESPYLIRKLIIAMNSNQLTEVISLAHKFKGSAKNMGGEKLAHILELIEKSANQHEPKELEKFLELIDVLNIEFVTFINALNSFNR